MLSHTIISARRCLSTAPVHLGRRGGARARLYECLRALELARAKAAELLRAGRLVDNARANDMECVYCKVL